MHGRTEPCERMLRALSNAECATITTSNAASLLLISGALAFGRDIVVAARDLIEISEGVRVGDIVEASGARVVPVGAANCVNIEDFRRAITPDTAMVMRSHASNVAATGYVEHVADVDLGRLAQKHGVPFVVNLGGGSLVDLTERGLPECPTISHAVRDGADLVLASGDKIVGGPQAGIVVGKRDLLETIMRHPLARTCRPGKLTLAALEGTLASYMSGRAWERIPTLRLLATSVDSLRERACALAEGLRQRGYDAVAAEDHAQCGGAVLPGVDFADLDGADQARQVFRGRVIRAVARATGRDAQRPRGRHCRPAQRRTRRRFPPVSGTRRRSRPQIHLSYLLSRAVALRRRAWGETNDNANAGLPTSVGVSGQSKICLLPLRRRPSSSASRRGCALRLSSRRR